MVFFSAVQSMLVVMLICLIGWGITKNGWVPPSTDVFIPNLLTKVAIPIFLIGMVLTTFKREDFAQIATAALIPFSSIIITFVLFLAIGHLIGVLPKRQYLFANCASISNAVMIGIPVNIALFGEEAVPYCILYFIGNNVFFWAIGNTLIALDGMQGKKMSLREIIRHIFSPPLMGTICGIILLMSGITVPKVLMDLSHYMGNLSTPLAFLFVGITAARKQLDELRPDRDMWTALAGRLLISPMIILVLAQFLSMPTLEMRVFIIEAGLPSMVNITVMSAYYGADKKFAGTFITVSTLLGMLTIPFWMTVITAL